MKHHINHYYYCEAKHELAYNVEITHESDTGLEQAINVCSSCGQEDTQNLFHHDYDEELTGINSVADRI